MIARRSIVASHDIVPIPERNNATAEEPSAAALRQMGMRLFRHFVAVAVIAMLWTACRSRCPETFEYAPTAAIMDNLYLMREACRSFRKAEGRWPTTLQELVPRYIRRIPYDPVTKRADTWLFTSGSGDAPPDIRSGARGKNCAGVAYSSL